MKNTSYPNSKRFKISVLTTCAVFLCVAHNCSASPSSDVGRDLEKTLGKLIADQIEASYGVVKDPLLTNWVDRIGQKLAAVSGRTDVKYTFKVLNSDDINAMAAPGGYIFVNRGTLRLAKTEDELASVLGHEVGHVAGKHAMKQLNAQLLATLALAGFRAIKANTLGMVGSVAGGLALLKYSRDEENDADRRGLANAVKAGYRGNDMIAFFERMASSEKEKPSKFESYFLTHPPTDERIRRINEDPSNVKTSKSEVALGDGQVKRSLFKAADISYRHAINLDKDSSDAKERSAQLQPKLAHSLLTKPEMSETDKLSAVSRLDQISSTIEVGLNTFVAKSVDISKDQDELSRDLESCARSLSDASKLVATHDAFRYRQFARLANTFDQASVVSGNIRTSLDLSQSTITDLKNLCLETRMAVERSDGFAFKLLPALEHTTTDCLKVLTDNYKQLRSELRDAQSGIRNVKFASDSLANSYRLPLGFTNGQYDILDMQVVSAREYMRDSVTRSQDVVSKISRSRYDMSMLQIDFLARGIKRDDTGVNGIIAHYLTVPTELVQDTAKAGSWGEAISSVVTSVEDGTIKVSNGTELVVKPNAKHTDKVSNSQYLNASVLLQLIMQDLRTELDG